MPRPLIAAVVVMALAACSGGDDSAATTDPVSSSTERPTVASDPETSPPTSAAPTSTDAPATIDPTTTAPDPTTPPASTAPPPESTAAEPTPDEQAVIDAARMSTTTWVEVLRDPWDEELIRAAAALRTGPALERLIEGLAELRTNNIRGAVHPDVDATIEMYEDSVVFETPDRATVEYCHVDSDLTVEVGAGPDGEDLVLDDSIVAKHQQAVMVRVGGRWLDETGTELARFEGATACDV